MTQLKFVPLALGVALIAIVLLLAIVFRSSRSFPAVPPGSYTGTISGLRDSHGAPATFYIERLVTSQSMLAVVFLDDWKPQVIRLTPLSRKDAFEPISLRMHGVEYTLFGQGAGALFAGEFISSEGSHGSWEVRPINPRSLHRKIVLSDGSLDLIHWLSVKSRLLKTRELLETEEKKLAQSSSKIEKLEKFIADEKSLRERAKERQGALAQQVSELKAKRNREIQELKGLVSELDLLTRIRKRGQVVHLARNLAKRENKWYFVNWGTKEDGTGFEVEFAQEAGIDLQKLNESYKRAKEISDLKRIIAIESEQVKALQATYYEKIRQSTEPAKDLRREPGAEDEQPEQPPEPRPWWERIGGVFG